MYRLPKTILLLSFIIFKYSLFCCAQTTTHQLKPVGAYDSIDVGRHNKAIAVLGGDNAQQKQQVINAILKTPGFYNPPVIYALSHVLFIQGKKDEGAYWFYVAQLRARYDANLCLDISAREAVAAMNQMFGPEINQYAFKDMGKLEKTVKKVVEFVRNNNEDYDHRWINLSGMGAVESSLGGEAEQRELTEPKSKWPAIKKKTIDDYYQGFLDAMKEMRKK